MKLPQGSKTLDEGVALLAARYGRIKAFVLQEVDELAKSGFADARWCAIARTDIEKGFLGLVNALPSARDGRNYGKHPSPGDPPPDSFTPPVGDAQRDGTDAGGFRGSDPAKLSPPLAGIEWKDIQP